MNLNIDITLDVRRLVGIVFAGLAAIGGVLKLIGAAAAPFTATEFQALIVTSAFLIVGIRAGWDLLANGITISANQPEENDE
ncbi:hypothetical protein [Halomarina oriensis]|uniref:Uncharacterized protein n=1 Tax=Halomarina oriensis TaxID=671145 RepID=A0A6B0GME6_9EURY|nr:hypothetical protein [Halomarina oriensis]MWG34837.1 hypothetical protein [Halomarina oriensis]